ncbi:MAG: sel1 repeat family protein [Rhodospirillaceae bacterium]|nr:sel1 repeat family protein [Rhodospirillaceae bacterium]
MIAMVPPALEIPVLAQPSLEHPPVPAAPVIRTGSVLAGIRAYETKNYARAYEVWQPLAAAGEASAQFHLGALYFEGRGVRQDLAQARRWLRAALDQGQERARFLLGRVETQLATTG